MISLIAAGAWAGLQDPVFLEPVVGVPRVCVSFAPSAGPFKKKKDVRTWTQVREALEAGDAERAGQLLGQVKKDHPALRTVKLAIDVVLEVPAEGAEAVFDEVTDDACLEQTGALLGIIREDVEAALAHSEKAYTLAPDDADALVLYYLLHPDADVSDAIQTAAAAHPELASLQLIAGRAALDQGDFRLAVEHFARGQALGVEEVAEPLFHLRRMAGYLEDYLKQASTMDLPLDVIDFSKAEQGSESYEAAYLRSLGLSEGQELVAHFDTSQGEITCTLHHRRAPVTVANLVGLATGEQAHAIEARKNKPFFDGLIFHRVIPEFMVQGGDPEGNGSGNPGYRFVDELEPSLAFDQPGVLAMANSGPGTNGSQFFITEKPVPHLDGRHTIFGQCTPQSVEVVEKIARVAAKSDRPVEDVVIEALSFEVRAAEAKETP